LALITIAFEVYLDAVFTSADPQGEHVF